jgi:hypothetical protein
MRTHSGSAGDGNECKSDVMKTYGDVEARGSPSVAVPDDDVEDGTCRRRYL